MRTGSLTAVHCAWVTGKRTHAEAVLRIHAIPAVVVMAGVAVAAGFGLWTNPALVMGAPGAGFTLASSAVRGGAAAGLARCGATPSAPVRSVLRRRGGPSHGPSLRRRPRGRPITTKSGGSLHPARRCCRKTCRGHEPISRHRRLRRASVVMNVRMQQLGHVAAKAHP